MRLWLIRHATSAWTDEGRYSGISDPALSVTGLAEADAAGGRLQGLRVDRVRVSPLLRCRTTWDRLAPHLDPATPPAIVDSRLQEINYGAWEGRTRDEVLAHDPDAFASWDSDPTAAAPPGGESVMAVAERIEAALAEELAGDIPRVLWVAHRTVARILVARALGIPLARYRRALDHHPAAITILDLKAPDDGKLVAYDWGAEG
jgi:broad specificity phosphatase PhoE